MERIVRFLLAALLISGAASSCLKYDDAAIRHDMSLLEERIAKLEEAAKTYNENIASLQSLVGNVDGRVFVTAVTEVSGGYIISFSDGKTATIKDGKDGTDGKDGVDGKDGTTPVIGVKQDTDGEWYWTLNGDWMLGADWNKIRASGKDGKDGEDAIAPMLKIEGEYWYLSTDGGVTWTQMVKATGADGTPGADGCLFASVTYDESFVYLKLKDGTAFKVGRGASCLQAISVIPDYGDGSVNAKAGDFNMRFEIVPASAAASLTMLPDECFAVKAFYALTKASLGDAIPLPIIDRYVFDGILYLTVDGSGLGGEFMIHHLAANASLVIDDGFFAVTSGYFPLYEDYNMKAGHEYVDLGLSVLWATCNVGAVSPEGYGSYIAWGENLEKSSYTSESYLWGNPPAKYNASGEEVLEPDDDAARVNWGQPWRMPTKAEIDELCNSDNCLWVWVSEYGVYGYNVISKKEKYAGNHIFLPATGSFWNSTTVIDAGVVGNYWSSTANLTEPNDAYHLHIAQNFPRVSSTFRGTGMAIRPVCAR